MSEWEKGVKDYLLRSEEPSKLWKNAAGKAVTLKIQALGVRLSNRKYRRELSSFWGKMKEVGKSLKNRGGNDNDTIGTI